jgi:hypothetical protein
MTGVGFILYTFRDSTGMLRSIKTPGILCPESTVKLISTLATLKAYEPETIHLTAGKLILSGNSSSEYPTNSVFAHLDPQNNLPTLYTISHSGVADIPKAYNATVETIDQANHNITMAQVALLPWPYELPSHSVLDAIWYFGEQSASKAPSCRHQKIEDATKMSCLSICQGETSPNNTKQDSCKSRRQHNKSKKRIPFCLDRKSPSTSTSFAQHLADSIPNSARPMMQAFTKAVAFF